MTLLVALGLGWSTPAAAAATCPATVDGLPLSVAVPFSGTERPVAGGSTSLLCAYGEGVTASAEVQLTWSDGCGDATSAVADGMDAAPFDALADDLVAEVGGACPAAASTSFPYVPVALGGLLAVALVAALVRHRRPAPSRPDVAPVLALLTTADGRALARTDTGQWLALAALTADRGGEALGATRPGRRPARPELAALAHQLAEADR